MNEPRDPNVTTDVPSAPADSLRQDDPLGTTDSVRSLGRTVDHHPADPLDADAPASNLPTVPGYRVLREIARGGMGKVLAAHDLGLDRDVALKILLPGANADRFVRESKITARLPHPGIPPVHALGTLADGSPFLAMKLIAGQTLADEMTTADLPQLLQAFTQVCQAVGFAHSRGVIHRDLKPANVMVGAFGEVQVMDWGLARELRIADCRLRIEDDSGNPQSAIRNPQSEETQAGTVMGTPEYMAPEQARGETTDAHADVFALGGILCKILTGQPPFVGKSALEIIQRAGAADLAEAYMRLDGCGADAELVALCRRCLSPNSVDRPANGQAVADGLTAYLHGVQERLQAAERGRAVAVAREAEQRKRRRVWLGAAAALAVAVIGGLGAVLTVQRQAATALGQKNEDLEGALGRAEVREQVAVDAVGEYRKAVTDNPALRDDPQFADLRRTLLEAPTAFCVRLRDDLRADPTADARSAVRLAGVLYQFSLLRNEIGRKEDALAALVEADDLLTRSGGEEADWRLTAAVLLRKGLGQETLRDYDGALVTLDRAEGVLAARLRAEPADAVALDRLAAVIFTRALTLGRTNRRAEALAVFQEAGQKAAEAVRLAPELTEVHLMGFQIARFQAEEYTTQHRPDDALRSAEVAQGALELYRVRSKDPEKVLIWEADLLGVRGRVYQQVGKTAELGEVRKRVVEIRRDLVARRPSHLYRRVDLASALLELASNLLSTNRTEDAMQAVREARRLCEDVYRADTSEKSSVVFNTLTRSWSLEGNIHYMTGRSADAIAAFREMSRLYDGQVARGAATPEMTTNFAGNEYNLGTLLAEAGRVDEAMTAFRRSLDIRRRLAHDHPDRPDFRLNVAFTLGNMGKCVFPTDLPSAEGYFREAVAILADLAPKYPKAVSIRDGLARNRNSLADTLRHRGGLDEAFALFRQNLAADAKDESARRHLAMTERMRALRPRLADVLSGTARPATPTEAVGFAELCAARFQKRYAAAARLYGEAFAADPKLADDLGAGHRYRAASNAALASAGQGEDKTKLDDKERTRLRQQALDWLRADLALHTKQLETGKPADRSEVQKSMLNWRKDPDLAALRDAALAKLPSEEQKAFTQLWADVAAVLKKAETPMTKDDKR